MAIRQIWLGPFGPFLYDDADLYVDDPTLSMVVLRAEGQMLLDTAPLADTEVVRKVDIAGAGSGTLKRVYYVKRFQVTGEQDNPQVVTFASLTDDDGLTVPDFAAAPIIIVSPLQDRGANVVDGSETTTQFEIALSGITLRPIPLGPVEGPYYFNLEIRGESV